MSENCYWKRSVRRRDSAREVGRIVYPDGKRFSGQDEGRLVADVDWYSSRSRLSKCSNINSSWSAEHDEGMIFPWV
jgi:hypothetical protein